MTDVGVDNALRAGVYVCGQFPGIGNAAALIVQKHCGAVLLAHVETAALPSGDPCLQVVIERIPMASFRPIKTELTDLAKKHSAVLEIIAAPLLDSEESLSVGTIRYNIDARAIPTPETERNWELDEVSE